MRATFAYIVLIFIATYLSLGLNIPVFRQLFGFVFLTLVPGYVTLHIIKLKEKSIINAILFSVGLSIAFVMFIGFFLNVLLPIFGIPNPLSLIPIAIAIASVTIVILIINFLQDQSRISVKTTHGNSVTESKTSERNWYVLFGAILVLLPLLSAIGAIYMDTFILIFAIIVIATLFAASIFLRKYIPSGLHPLIILSISISLLLQTVLISKHIVGWDIFTEYYVFKQTANLGYWNAPGIIFSSADFDTYNSLLSVTILPSVYSTFLNLDGELIFKFVYPLIFSLLPLALYRTFRLQSEKSISLLATFFFMSNTISFYGLEPLSVTRQIIAELFLVLATLCLIDKNMNLSKRRLFFMIFSTALVVSHYSLSYIFLFFVVLTYVFSRIRRKDGMLNLGLVRKEGMLNLGLVLFLIAMTFAWYMYVSTPPLNRLARAFKNMVQRLTVDLFQPQARFQPGLMPLSPTTQSSLVGSVHKISIYISMFFVGIGLIVLVVKPKEFKLDPEFRLMSIFSGFLLVLCMAVPNLAPTLNFTRFYAITLLFLAPFFALGGMYFLGLIGKFFSSSFMRSFKFFRRDLELRIVTLVLVVFFLFQVGFFNHVMNGPTYSYSLDFNRIKTSTDPNIRAKILSAFVPEQDFFSARWLGANIDNKSLVYADYRIGQPVLADYVSLENQRISYLFNTTELDPRPYYIYLRYLNVREGIIDTATGAFNLSDISTLLARSDKIYSNGESEIYYTP